MSHLLLIEDNVELRKVLAEALELDGYEVDIARDGEEGLAMLNRDCEPTVIVCDIALPHMNGLEFLNRIRGNPLWAHILVIAMSGTITLKQEALEAGANQYLVKPFSFQELYDALAK